MPPAGVPPVMPRFACAMPVVVPSPTASRYWTVPPVCFRTIDGAVSGKLAGFTHASIVIDVVKESVALGATRIPEPDDAVSLNAWPTRPAANVAPFTSAPLLTPRRSSAVPSPVHQLTSPDGDVTGT